MALTLGYSIKLKTEFLGQSCLNIFHYQLTVGEGNATLLAVDFFSNVLPDIKAVSSNKVFFRSLETRSLLVPTDFDIRDLTGTGSVSGSALGSHDAWSLRYTSNRVDAKDGGKRFVGVPESLVDDGQPGFGADILIAQLESALETPLTPIGATFRPRIKGSLKNTIGEFLNPISSIDFIGQYTQNTRKRYTRGIF